MKTKRFRKQIYTQRLKIEKNSFKPKREEKKFDYNKNT